MEYGLIGEKLGHSYSKIIHSKLGDYNYELVEVDKNDITEFMTKHNFKGINVTIPYKKTVIPFLDYIDPQAKEIGAVNTVVLKDGKLYGYNTDFYGLSELINKNDIVLKDKMVAILGTGGTSNTASAVSRSMNADKIIKVSRRATDNTIISYDDLYKMHSEIDVIINTTPVGMYPNVDGCPVDVNKFENLSGVVDVIYNPITTELVRQAKDNGVKAVNGLYMLVAQAACAAQFFFDDNSYNMKNETVYNEIKNEMCK